MNINKDKQIKDCIDNWDKYVSIMTKMSDKKLAYKLETVYLQSEIAVQKRMTSAVELLDIWISQIIEARILKAENNIPDEPSEIELAIAENKRVIAQTEQRQEKLDEYVKPENQSPPKIQPEQDNDTQLSLF